MTFSQALIIGVSTAFLTGILSLLAQFFIARLQRANERDKALAAEKRAAYQKLLKMLYSLLGSSKSQPGPASLDSDDIFAIERDLTVYASDKVFRLFVNLRQASDENKDVVTPLKNLVLEIRKDVGHPQTNLSLDEILAPILKTSGKINRY